MNKKSNLKTIENKQDLFDLINSIYKTAYTLKNTKEKQDLFDLIDSIYKIAYTLKDTEDKQVLLRVVNSIYKIAYTLKDTEDKQVLLKIVNSTYKISCTLDGRENKQVLLLYYMDGIKQICQSKSFVSNQSEIISNITKFNSFGQLKSKVWLVDTLKEKKLFNLGNVFLCAGWYGALSIFLLNEKKLSIHQMFNFEKDPLSVKCSEDLNRKFVKDNWRFKATLKDILELDYYTAQFDTLKANGEVQTLRVSPDTIINTSCEHMDSFSKWWNILPKKKLLILQSNDFFQHEEHVNSVPSLEDFKRQAPMDLLYEGELELEKYKRFMLIGYKN